MELTSQKQPSSIRENLLTALGVFVGLFWGFGFQETAIAGTATLQLASSNATSTLSTIVSQTQTSLILVLRATAAQAILFVALLVIPRIPTKPARYPMLQRVFPFVTILAWFALLLSAMASSIPQVFLTIKVVCGPSTPEINFAVGQLFTFLEFSRAYVDAAGVLALFTGIWLAAVLNTGPLYSRRLLIRFFVAVVLPLVVFGIDYSVIPLINPAIDPCIALMGSGSLEELPSWWGYIAVPILLIFMGLGLLVLRRSKSPPTSNKPTHAEVT